MSSESDPEPCIPGAFPIDTEHNDSGSWPLIYESTVSALRNAGQKVRQFSARAIASRLCTDSSISAPHAGTAEERSPQRTDEGDFSEPAVRNDASKPLHDVQDRPSKGDEELREEERDTDDIAEDSCTTHAILTTTSKSRQSMPVVHAEELASGVEDEFVIAGQTPTLNERCERPEEAPQIIASIAESNLGSDKREHAETRREAIPSVKKVFVSNRPLSGSRENLGSPIDDPGVLPYDLPGYCTPALARVIIEDRLLADYPRSRSQSRHRSEQTSTEVPVESLLAGQSVTAKLDTPKINHQDIQMPRDRLRGSSDSVSTTSVVDRIEPSEVGSEDVWQPSLVVTGKMRDRGEETSRGPAAKLTLAVQCDEQSRTVSQDSDGGRDDEILTFDAGSSTESTCVAVSSSNAPTIGEVSTSNLESSITPQRRYHASGLFVRWH
ncbi:hypothetical protein AX15_001424 [Amanita polypyramis BW_CC]|nr:hypothetical protein AX15_001424 [Amanita polypyramis BW_CC]